MWLSLILFVYFLILPSLLHPSIYLIIFYTCYCTFFYCPLGNSCLSALPGMVCPFNAGLYCQWVKLRLCPYYLVVIFCKCVIRSSYVQKKFRRFSFLHNQERWNREGGQEAVVPPLPLKVEVATNIGNNMTFYILCTYVATNIKLAGVYLTEFAPPPKLSLMFSRLIIILCILAADIMHTLPSASKGWPKYMYMHTILFQFQVTRQLYSS